MKLKFILRLSALLLVIALILASCTPFTQAEVVNTEYILTSAIRNGKFVYLGVNGNINGLVNPALRVRSGEKITVFLVNSGEGDHDIVFPDLNVRSDTVSKKGETTSVTFVAPDRDTTLEYHDSRLENMGMKGLLLVGNVIDPDQAIQPTLTDPQASSEIPASSVVQNDPAAALPATGNVVAYTLGTAHLEGKMIYIGVGGEIDGQINPDLTANPGDTVQITLISGDGAEHNDDGAEHNDDGAEHNDVGAEHNDVGAEPVGDHSEHNIFFEAFNALSENVKGEENSVTLEFAPDQEGTFTYYCTIPGHLQAGMEGKLIVGSGESVETAANQQPETSTSNPVQVNAEPADENAVDISRSPTDLPGPLAERGPEQVRIDLETLEIAGVLADGTTYHFWTFNGKVPGPFLRIRVGDTVEVHLKNAADSSMSHSVDFHAVTGPGGGAVATQTAPGDETVFTFKALNPGLFVYHCATPMVALHISNGMYGLILVEPEGGLPAVDREFYVMQGELYTAQPMGTDGNLTVDVEKLLNEDPEYFTFNGAPLTLAGDEHALRANTGETVRIFLGVGGPNFTSSFHVIGEIFDRVYDQASLTAPPLTDVQTTLVPPGGATMVEFKLEVPGRYILVDHALARLERGLAGYLYAEGEPALDIFNSQPAASSEN